MHRERGVLLGAALLGAATARAGRVAGLAGDGLLESFGDPLDDRVELGPELGLLGRAEAHVVGGCGHRVNLSELGGR